MRNYRPLIILVFIPSNPVSTGLYVLLDKVPLRTGGPLLPPELNLVPLPGEQLHCHVLAEHPLHLLCKLSLIPHSSLHCNTIIYLHGDVVIRYSELVYFLLQLLDFLRVPKLS